MKFIRILLVLHLLLGTSLYAQKKAIEIVYEKIDNGYIFSATNNSNVPYYLKFQFSELTNLQPNQQIDSYTPTIYPNQDKKEVLILNIENPSITSSFNFNYVYTIGEPDVELDNDFLYWLPYQHAKRVRVGQGYNGKGTHRGINAIDFNMDIGDTIFAARSGFVYDIKEDSDKGGNSLSYEKYGNYIHIYHADGTLAKYVHLMKDGAIVELGDSVKIGQAIGLSGNTGYSSGPHLHFTVIHNEQFQSKTLAVSFLNYNKEAFIPQENKAYYAYHPGSPSFKVEDESSFNEAKLESQQLKSTLLNKVEIESETYGDYTLLYVNNGTSHTIKGNLMLELEQMKATKNIPYEFSVEGNTKQYLLAIIPEDKAEKFSYKLSVQFKR